VFEGRLAVSIDSLRSAARSLHTAIFELAALGAALRARLGDGVASGSIRLAIEPIVERLGVTGAIAEADQERLAGVLAEIRLSLLQACDLVERGGRSPGWTHIEPAFLHAAGAVSSEFPRAIQQMAGSLDGLSERLAAPGATFLDVGAGVGALSIGMARLWPALRVVGVDPWPPSIEIAKRMAAESGCGDRIELRLGRAEDLTEREAFDLCWLPGAFMSAEALPRIVCRLVQSLRPAGWLLVGLVNPGSDDGTMNAARLRTALFGGTWIGPGDLRSMLESAGLRTVCLLPTPPFAAALIVGARRP
jgi:2-polyprenyl-3-methyl-5-hydroxy-6-metoxy-1,4-benzoquinol methylase